MEFVDRRIGLGYLCGDSGVMLFEIGRWWERIEDGQWEMADEGTGAD
jgi:hypothetical protein